MSRTRTDRGRVPTWLRVLLPTVLILGWLAAAGLGGPTFGQLSTVVSNDQTSFLPATSDATTVQDALPEFLGADEVPAIVVVAGADDLDASALEALESLQQSIADLDGVVEVSPLVPSEDGQAGQIVVLLDSSGSSESLVEHVEALREAVADAGLDASLQTAVTGPAGFTADIVEAFTGIDGILLLVALSAVLVILIIVYRSPLLPLLVLFTSVAALCLAILVVFQLAKAEILTLSGQTQGILFILVVGAATDYGLLYTARFREALGETQSRWEATVRALKGSFEPIIAAGGTVIAGLLCLLLSDLISNQQLGPVAAIGIVTSILAGLTLLPALLLAFGRVAFWPLAPSAPASRPTARACGALSRAWSTAAPAPSGSPARCCWASARSASCSCRPRACPRATSSWASRRLATGRSSSRSTTRAARALPRRSSCPRPIRTRWRMRWSTSRASTASRW